MTYQNPEEFYRLMLKKTKEIESLDISEHEKQKMLSLVKETISRYEEMTEDVERREIAFRELDKGLANFRGVCGKVDNCIGELAKTLYSVNMFVRDYRVSQNRDKN